jgi:hypothetical protein
MRDLYCNFSSRTLRFPFFNLAHNPQPQFHIDDPDLCPSCILTVKSHEGAESSIVADSKVQDLCLPIPNPVHLAFHLHDEVHLISCRRSLKVNCGRAREMTHSLASRASLFASTSTSSTAPFLFLATPYYRFPTCLLFSDRYLLNNKSLYKLKGTFRAR